MPPFPTQGRFLERTRGAKKVMVLDLGFLGDTVHTLPALWMIRQAYPQAELHFAVEEHVTSLLQCTPWVNRVWGYPRFPRHATLRQNLQMITRMRREHFDVLINLNGSDRSSWLGWLSGARERLGQNPRDTPPPLWRYMFTETIGHLPAPEPSYWLKCRGLQRAGFPFTRPEFHVELKQADLEAAEIMLAEAGTYFHLSPFTTADDKELSHEQLVQLIRRLEQRFPEKRLVISAAPTNRERQKMQNLLAALPHRPWKVFPGNLSLVQLAAVIQHCAVHLCGDTGTLHLALLTGAPSVSWFRSRPGMSAWIPVGERHRTITTAPRAGEAPLAGIETGEIISAVESVLNLPRIPAHLPLPLPSVQASPAI